METALRIVSIVSCFLGQTWQQFDPTGFDAAATSAARWGRVCFSDEECQVRVLPVEDGVNTLPSSSGTLLPSIRQTVDVVSVTNDSWSDAAPLQVPSHPSTLTPSLRAPTAGSPNPIPTLVGGQGVLSPASSISTTLSPSLPTYSFSTSSSTAWSSASSSATSSSASSSAASSSTNSPTTPAASFAATSDIGVDLGVDVDFDSTLNDLFDLADGFRDGLGDGLGTSTGDDNDPSVIIMDNTQTTSMLLQPTSSGMASSPPATGSPAGLPLASTTPLTASSTKLPVAEPDLMMMMLAVDGFGFGSMLNLPVAPKPATVFETPFLLQLKKVLKTHMPSTSQTINHISHTTLSPPLASSPASTPPTTPDPAPSPPAHSPPSSSTPPPLLGKVTPGVGASNVPASSMSGLTTDVAINLSDMGSSPKWLQEGYPAMMGLHLGDQWQSCVALFVEFERHFNFSKKNYQSWNLNKLPFTNITQKLFDDHLASWSKWWQMLQPSERSSPTGGLLHRSGLNWSLLRKCGGNGFISVMVSIAWWGYAIWGGSVDVEDGDLMSVIDDVQWVLRSMLELHTSGLVDDNLAAPPVVSKGSCKCRATSEAGAEGVAPKKKRSQQLL
ncbi:hypothetical protein JAAARDRAFT_197151 [Jaapia argillacea MUCL 33604]|uniref:Uncharacterized protein n=1 Tax=Jaapia argillacea MUCL 33604 TaxID=933084 RepID=A0A067PFK3_9AGAM|nr:hypothetical protein JAAARDRAFT_197151 [Jaapia argillacea MUCL 33604]